MTVTEHPDGTFTVVLDPEERAAVTEAVRAGLIPVPGATLAAALHGYLMTAFTTLTSHVRTTLIGRISTALPTKTTRQLSALLASLDRNGGPPERAEAIEVVIGPIEDQPPGGPPELPVIEFDIGPAEDQPS
jgi:hypothetical protein